jgi:hypothetical protein
LKFVDGSFSRPLVLSFREMAERARRIERPLGVPSFVFVLSLEVISMRYASSLTTVFTLGMLSAGARGTEPAADRAKPVPTTRPEVKQALEALKWREARIPLPPATDA